jgi:ADP-heptose:LPS heptosyltransferase
VATHRRSPGSFYETIVSRAGQARVCVIRKVGGIGDVLMVTPALRQLKKDFPKLHITYAIDMHTTGSNIYHELMKNCPFVDELIDARYVDHGTYDATVDVSAVCLRFERQELPAINRVDLFGRAMGLRRISDRRSWYKVEDDERRWAAAQYAHYRSGGKKIVILHTASMEEKRCWPIEKYLELIRLAEQDHLPVQFAVLDFNNKYSGWAQHSNVLNVSATTVRQMAALISEADLFIGPDSGPMHIAGALNTRSLVLFGSIPPLARINYYASHEAVTLSGLSCLGCWYKACPINTKCMKDLPSSTVYNKMRSLL